MSKPDLSVIIPTLNEEDALPFLLKDLVSQKHLSLEIIVSDGNSSDSTLTIAEQFLSNNRMLWQTISGNCGRGRQLNAGASIAKADWLLFLHADSRLLKSEQLYQALDRIKTTQKKRPETILAGRFILRFDGRIKEPDFARYYYQVKAQLGRPGCIHGDQGCLMSKSSFNKIGHFRIDLPVMEDTALAEKVRTKGEWILFNSEILTSTRRFEVEGWRQRQTLNALMMNFFSIGWFDFFVKAKDSYQSQDRASLLELKPYYELIQNMLKQLPRSKRFRLWMATGAYVRSQAWQLMLALDCKRKFKKDFNSEYKPAPWLKGFDSWFDTLTDHWVGHLATAFLVRLWFSVQLMRST